MHVTNYVPMTHRTRYARIGLIVVIESVVVMYLVVKTYQKIQDMFFSPKYVVRLSKEQYPFTSSSIFPHFYEPKPNSIVHDHPEWLGYNVSYSINSDSLNERMEYQVVKPSDTFRIIMLGNSFTFGLFVNTNENYSELLEMSLQNHTCLPYKAFDVINLGVPGYDIGYSAERYRLRGQKYHPDLVVWFVNPSTFETLSDRMIELEGQYLQKLSREEIQRHEKAGEYYFVGRRAWDQLVSELSPEERITKQVKYFADFSAYYTGPLLIVANQWSDWPKYARLAMRNAVLLRPQTWVYEELPSLSQVGALLPDKHPNVKGHKLIALGIYAYLLENHLLPCSEAAP